MIVPVYNGGSTLARLLDSIGASDFSGPLEVLIVDDGSTDRSIEIASRYPVRIIRQERNQGVAAARNAGARHARAPLYFFCDADIRLCRDTLSLIVAEFNSRADLEILNCGVTTHPLTAGIVGTYLAYKGGYDHWRLEQEGVSRIPTSYLQTLAVAMRRQVFEDGGFDLAYADPGGEEYEFGHRLSSRYTLWLYPGIHVDHDTKPWRARLKANIVRCSRWVPLFAQRGFRFESATGVATWRRSLSSLLATAALLAVPGFFVHWSIGLFGLVAFLARIPLVGGLFRLLAGEQGLRIAVPGFMFELVYESCFGLGFAWGTLLQLTGRLGRAASAPARIFRRLQFLFTSSPPHLVWFCTAVCNQSCTHCFYWDKLNRGASELSLGEVGKIAAKLGHVHHLTLTGGEPSTRTDLVDCVEILCRVNGLQSVGYHTNGMLPNRIRRHAVELLQRCPELTLTVSVSLDHFEEQHDAIRGVAGAYRRALDTIDRLKPLRSNRNFHLCVNSVYSAANAAAILDLHRFVVETLGVEHAFGLVRGQPRIPAVRSVDLANFRTLLAGVPERVARGRQPFAAARRALDDATRALVLDAAERGRACLPCMAGRKTIVLGESGNVFPCELLAQPFGNVRECAYDIPGLLRTPAARTHLAKIVDERCYCTWECVQPLNLIFNREGRTFLVRRWLAHSVGLPPPAAPRGCGGGINADPVP